MNEAGGPQRLPGPKTLLRTGALLSPFGVGAGDCAADTGRDRGAAVRRTLIEEIRAQATPPIRRKRRR